jgi:hypothetical protein
MKKEDKDNSKILFKDDYRLLVEKLIEENSSHESIRTNFDFYKGSNPYFLKNLLDAAYFLAGVELKENHLLDIINDEEIQYLTNLLLACAKDVTDSSKIDNTIDEMLRIEMKNLKNFKLNDREARFIYARILLDIFSFIAWNKIYGEGEDPFTILTTNEKLYLLDLLIESKLLERKGTSKELEVILSLITGIKSASLEKPLKLRDGTKTKGGWFDVEKEKSPSVIQSRLNSLMKIKDNLEIRGIKKSKIIDMLSEVISTTDLLKNKNQKKTKQPESKKIQ